MADGIRPVNRDAHPLHSGLQQTGGDLWRKQGTVGRNYHPEPQTGAISRQFQQIFPQQRLAPGKNNHHLAHTGQIIKKRPTLFRSQFAWIRPLSGRSPAMRTGQITAPGDFPGQQAEGRNFYCTLLGRVHFLIIEPLAQVFNLCQHKKTN